ncbi:hypothetical protein Taro_016988 [Colocasia esculenta]|uniref:Uncharacterized protein n=1 Tax=Colocasia esculenta TaxID=4460 RepID=A0A843UMC5_COLES|nr:hypothetical protein [Colocasia esculenta]
MNAELQSFKGELGSIKLLVQDLSVFVREQLPTPTPPAPTLAVPKSNSGPSGPIDAEEEVWPLGPRIEEEIQSSGPSIAEEEFRPSGLVGAEDAGPSGPKVVEGQPAHAASGPSTEQPGPLGPVVDEQSGPSEPVESQDEQGRVEAPVEEAVPLEPPSSPLQTPAPPSPPSSTTAPLALATFKQPLPKHISSPTPFPTTTSSSPASSTFIPPPPSEAPPVSSSLTGASSFSPSSSEPSIPPPSTAYSFLHPPTPPSFVTIIPEDSQLEGPFIQDIKDEFEVAILRSVLSVDTHIHRTGSSSHAPKKRKISSNLATSSEPRGSKITPVIPTSIPHTVRLHYSKEYNSHRSTTTSNTLELDGSNTQPRARRLQKLSTTAQTTTGAQRLQIEHDGSNHTSKCVDTQADFVDTTGFNCSDCFLRQSSNLSTENITSHIKSDVLAPLLSECERLSPSDWERLYPLTAQQLLDFNASQDRSNQPPLSAVQFLDLNSIHLVRDPFDMWVERYKVYISMKKELKHQQIFYPISIDQFLQHASFGTSSTYKMSLGKDEYGNFVEAQRQLHIQRMAPIMGHSYSIVYGSFQGYFEE